jgi:hypothetical protein
VTDPRDSERDPKKPQPGVEFTAGFYWYVGSITAFFLWASIRMLF